jgi:hypothetical protein
MEVAALGVQQSMAQSKMSIAMVKQSAQTEQAIVDLIKSAAGQGRGQNLDISV